MATFGDDLGRTLGTTAETNRSRDGRLRAAAEAPNVLPAPTLPPPTLPPPTLPPPTSASPMPTPPTLAAPTLAPTTPERNGAPSPSLSSFSASAVGARAHPPTGVAAESFAEIRAVHEATTQQLRERRSPPGSGRAVSIACAVVVIGGIAFVLGSLWL